MAVAEDQVAPRGGAISGVERQRRRQQQVDDISSNIQNNGYMHCSQLRLFQLPVLNDSITGVCLGPGAQ